jgi:hypothetical protein
MPTASMPRTGFGTRVRNTLARLRGTTRKVKHLNSEIDEQRYHILDPDQKKLYKKMETNGFYKLISNNNSSSGKTMARLPYRPYNINKIRQNRSSVKSIKNRIYSDALIETLTDLDTLCWKTVERRNSRPRYLGKYLGQITPHQFTTYCYFEKEGPVENEQFSVVECQAGGRRNKAATKKIRRNRSYSFRK